MLQLDDFYHNIGHLNRLARKSPSRASRTSDHAHHVFSPCRAHAASRFSGVSTPRASAKIIQVKPHQPATQFTSSPA
jgi:hypothetical protein